jgi:tRNA(fMet)-specific endonuclease VapC
LTPDFSWLRSITELKNRQSKRKNAAIKLNAFIRNWKYSFDEPAALKYSIIRTQLEKDGLVISERDLQIASIATANKLILVTHNVKEFKRIVKLEVEDWANESGR